MDGPRIRVENGDGRSVIPDIKLIVTSLHDKPSTHFLTREEAIELVGSIVAEFRKQDAPPTLEDIVYRPFGRLEAENYEGPSDIGLARPFVRAVLENSKYTREFADHMIEADQIRQDVDDWAKSSPVPTCGCAAQFLSKRASVSRA